MSLNFEISNLLFAAQWTFRTQSEQSALFIFPSVYTLAKPDRTHDASTASTPSVGFIPSAAAAADPESEY